MRIYFFIVKLFLLLNIFFLSTLSYSEITAEHLMSLETAAIDGDVDAQAQLASMYYLGEGVEQNLNQAFAWYQLAAEQGDAVAQYSLGNLFLLGEGTAVNKNQAIFWYQKSAAQGHKKAQSRLSLLNVDFIADTNQESSNDVNRYAGAPLENETVNNKEEILIEKESVTTDINLEEKTSDNLFDQLFYPVQTNQVVINEKQKSAKVSSNTEQTKANQKQQNLERKTSAISNLQPGPIVNNEVIDENSEKEEYQPITEDNSYLYKLYNKARDGDADAQYLIANAYYLGNEVQQNLKQAFLWYRRSAENGHIDGQFQLANIYLMGEGVQQDDEAALYWYGKAAGQNHPDALKNYESLKQFSSKKDRKADNTAVQALPVE